MIIIVIVVFVIVAVVQTLQPEQMMMDVGSKVSRKAEFAPALMAALGAFDTVKAADGSVDDEQEKEDELLNNQSITYVQGGETLEIDYGKFKKIMSSGLKAKIRV